MLEEFILRINMVQNYICIPFMTCCENCHLVVLVHLLQHLLGTGSNIETGLVILPRLKSDIKFDVRDAIRALCVGTDTVS